MNVLQKLEERSSLAASKGKEGASDGGLEEQTKCKVQLQRSVQNSVQNAPAPLRNGIVEPSFEEQVPVRSPRQEEYLHFHMDGP